MRLRLVMAFVFVVFVLLLSRVYYLAIKSNVYYEEMARTNAVKSITLAPTRGLIFDTKGRLLAENDLGFSVAMKPYLWIKKDSRKLLDEEIAFLAQFFPDLNTTAIRRHYTREDSYYNQDFIEVAEFVPYEKMMAAYSELNLRENLLITPTVKRRYPYESIASHIIGYIGRANLEEIKGNDIAKITRYIGKSGVEKHYNEFLQGVKGVREIKVNALNKEVEQLRYEAPKSRDLTLNIDIELQRFLTELFAENAGVAIIMDANDGSILAAGSFPEYDLNLFVSGISHEQWRELSDSPEHPFINKMINGLYPPGSVVKMGTGLAFLNSGVFNARGTFFCEGVVEISGRFFRCWNRIGHGDMNLRDSIKHSCDIYFYEGALKVGIDKIAPTLQKMGFGSKTGVDLPNEFIGIMPSREWKLRRYNMPWFRGETINTSIGQGNFLVTPMQIAKYTAQIASGKKITPHFVKNIENLENGVNSSANLGGNLENGANFANSQGNLGENLKNNSNSNAKFSENSKNNLNLGENAKFSKADLNSSSQNANFKGTQPNLSEQNELFTPFEQRQLPLIREAMLAVAKEPGGTAFRYFENLPLNVAAKTGTAQVVGFSQTDKKNVREKDLAYYSRSHTWLTSFAPYENPRYVVTVLLEHGGKSLTSNAIAVEIYKKLIELGYLQRQHQKPKRLYLGR